MRLPEPRTAPAATGRNPEISILDNDASRGLGLWLCPRITLDSPRRGLAIANTLEYGELTRKSLGLRTASMLDRALSLATLDDPARPDTTWDEWSASLPFLDARHPGEEEFEEEEIEGDDEEEFDDFEDEEENIDDDFDEDEEEDELDDEIDEEIEDIDIDEDEDEEFDDDDDDEFDELEDEEEEID